MKILERIRSSIIILFSFESVIRHAVSLRFPSRLLYPSRFNKCETENFENIAIFQANFISFGTCWKFFRFRGAESAILYLKIKELHDIFFFVF